MTTKFGIGIVFTKTQVSAKFHCPTSTVTLFFEYGEGRIRSSPAIESQNNAISKKHFPLFTICQKNNCYRSKTLLFGLGWTIMVVCNLNYKESIDDMIVRLNSNFEPAQERRGGGEGGLSEILGRYVPRQNQKSRPITLAKCFIEYTPKTCENDMNLLIFLDLRYNPCKNLKILLS